MPKKSNTFAFAMIIALVFIAALFYYYVTHPVHYGDVQISGEGEAGSGGKMGVGATIEFTDGTSKTVDPSQIQYTLFPLTVYFEGKRVSKITWHCYVLLDWTGQLTSLELKGPMEVKSNTGMLLRKENILKTYTSANLPGKNVWFVAWSFSLSADDIEYSLSSSGDYTLTCTVSLTATAMFSTGQQSVKTASTSGNLPIKIEAAGITAMLCEVQTQVFN